MRSEPSAPYAGNQRRAESDDDALAYEPRWGRWKVTLVVVLFCVAFWSGVGYIATRLLS